MSRNSESNPRLPVWAGWALAATVYLAGLVCAGVYFRHALNADAVAYLRIASYYAAGKWDLAVSGYWGPLASWCLAVLLKLGLPALVAARVFMAASAVVFVFGCRAVYHAFELPPKWARSGTALAALASGYWSVQFITPDLLLSGFICFAASRMFAKTENTTALQAAGTGLLWGLAYLTKAVAFPLALLATIAFAGLALLHPALKGRLVLRQVGLLLLAFTLVAGPWVLVLSLKYRTPTFSTTARISHTLTGPPDAERYHPFGRTFHQPEAGRITSWEEPSRMAYNYWSPWEKPAYTWHQVKVVARNISTCVVLVSSLNLAWLWLLPALALQRVCAGQWPEQARACGRALLLPGLVAIIYLPCYVALTEQRFFYCAFPFLFAALVIWAARKEDPRLQSGEAFRSVLRWSIVPGALLPLVAALFVIGTVPKYAGDCAADLARRLERAQLAGPVAGSAMLPGGRTGLYVAFLLGQPWYGDEKHPTPESFKACGARLITVNRYSGLAAALDLDPAFIDLDRRLFADAAEADRFPVKVYESKR